MNRPELFVFDKNKKPFERTTHLAIVAHPDDVEILAYHGILQCYNKSDKWFSAVVTGDGAGSPRTGKYSSYTNKQMIDLRIEEQKRAAVLGQYGFLSILKFSSKEIKEKNPKIVELFADIIQKSQPDIIYTHNLADKHLTHVKVVVKVIEAIRSLQKEIRPKKLFGCEVWRDLDWLNDDKRVKLVCDGNLKLEKMLLNVFDSQIMGGKRYDLATLARRTANATFSESHLVDNCKRLTYAMDLTPLIIDDNLSINDYVTSLIDEFKISALNNFNDDKEL